jgi:hypothetical protein
MVLGAGLGSPVFEVDRAESKQAQGADAKAIAP